MFSEENAVRVKQRPKNKRLVILGVVLVVIVLLLGGTAAYYFQKYQKIKKSPDIVEKEEINSLVEKISKLIDLPQGETPTLATILDKEKLKDQPFFNNAQNGDKILIYTKAQKAIVYRVAENKIINVGPITLNQNGQLSVVLVNAGGNVADIEKKLADKFGSGIGISGKTEAKNRNSVSKTTIVDVSGQNTQVVKDIAAQLGGTVGRMPDGETVPQGAAVAIFVK